jgi:NUMOD4 motif/HNH endonuclease
MVIDLDQAQQGEVWIMETQKLEWHAPTVTELVIPEEWRSVVGFDGAYEVSNYGKVKSLARETWKVWKVSHSRYSYTLPERILKFGRLPHGYLIVHLYNANGRHALRVHTLVLMAFLGPCPPGMECRHLNGNPADNRLINLVWGTHWDNLEDRREHGTMIEGERHTQAKLTKWNVLIDIPVYTAMGLSQHEIGKKLGVVQATIRDVLIGKNWTHLYQEPPPVFTPEIEQEYIAIRGMMSDGE